MLYYRVKPEYQDTELYKIDKKRKCLIADGMCLIRNELWTQKEIERYSKNHLIPMKAFEKVEIKKTDTYWFFGARFSVGHGFNDTEVM